MNISQQLFNYYVVYMGIVVALPLKKTFLVYLFLLNFLNFLINNSLREIILCKIIFVFKIQEIIFVFKILKNHTII